MQPWEIMSSYEMFFAPIIMIIGLVTVIVVVVVAVIRWLHGDSGVPLPSLDGRRRALESFTKLLASITV